MARLSGNPAGMIGALGAAESAAKKMGDTTDQTSRKVSGGFSRMAVEADKHKQSWNQLGNAAIVGGALLVAGVAMVVKSYAAFDKQMSNVKAATHGTASEMNLLRTAAINAGADTAFSAVEAAQGIEELAKAGITTGAILSGGLRGALSLAAAGEIGVGEAAEVAATALTVFKLKGDQIPHVADLLAAAAGKAQGSVTDMGNALKMSALVAAQTGLTIEETTGGLAAFAAAGLLGSDAGTSFKTMLMRLTPNSKEAQEKMNELGISAYDASGHFIGLSKFAGNLQEKMETLDPKARAAAMGIIFGSDAVRAANILYERGAEGIQEWIDKVNSAGYAAVTAAIKQDNLAGDIEKLGGSIDSVFLKSGSGMNDVLRKIIQSTEDLIDWIGSLDPKVLQTSLQIALVTGAGLILFGTFMKLVPAIGGMITNFRNLGDAGSTVPGTMGKITKAAGLLLIAVTALQILGAIFTERTTKSAEDYGNAILAVSEAGMKAKAADLDTVFQGWDKSFGVDRVQNVNSMADAVRTLTDIDFNEWMNLNMADHFNEFFGMAKSEIGQTTDRMRDFGKALAETTQNGGLEAAGKSFSLLSAEFEKNGKSAADALEQMPAYKQALLDQAQAAGVSLTPNELLVMALGGMPEKLRLASGEYGVLTTSTGASVPVTEALKTALDNVGLAVDGTVAKLGTFVEIMQRAGLLTLSERDQQRQYAEALAAVGLQADGTGAQIGKLTGGFDRNTEQGRKNEAMFDAVARSGMATTKSMAEATDAFGNNIYTQEQLQGNLNTTFQNMVTAAGQFGVTGDAADALARQVMGIPPGVNIQTWMSDYAKTMADKTAGSVNSIPGRKDVTVGIAVYGLDQIEAARQALGNLAANSMITANAYASGNAYRWNGGPIEGFANGGFPGGGFVNGPGTATSDSILAALSAGEYVVKAASVNKYGLDFMRAVNDGSFNPAQSHAPASSGAYATAGQGGGQSTIIFAPVITVEVEVPGMGETFTAKIKNVASDTVAGAMNDLTRTATSQRGTARGVYV
jgi:TP901 family phage tail tape measure protein